MMKYLAIALLIACCFGEVVAKPKDGIYTYKVVFAEWQHRSLKATCTVVIKGDSVIVFNDGSLAGKKGDMIDGGIMMKHKKTGKWIIGHRKEDVNAKEIGGCSDGPSIIDLKQKVFRTC